jgi:hypothetical protein
MARYGKDRFGTVRYAEDVPTNPHEVLDREPWYRVPDAPVVVEVGGVEITLYAADKYLFMEE